MNPAKAETHIGAWMGHYGVSDETILLELRAHLKVGMKVTDEVIITISAEKHLASHPTEIPGKH